MSVSPNIRGALQTRAALAAGFPPANQRAYENVVFTSTTGIPWARLTVMPQSGRPFSVSADDTAHMGLFQVDVFVPAGQGTAAAEIAADAVKAMFRAGTNLFQGGERIQIDYAERAQTQDQPDWIFCPVTIGWRCYSANN